MLIGTIDITKGTNNITINYAITAHLLLMTNNNAYHY